MAPIVFSCALLASIAATQYLASAFQYHPALSGKITGNLYWPWSWITWSLEWGELHDERIKRGLAIFTSGTAFLLLLLVVYTLNRQRRLSAIEGLHGTAHWSNRQEIMASGLLPRPQTQSQGVYVGAWFDEKSRQTRYLRHNGPEHVLAFAPTRSGKGVGLVIPTLLSWPHSTVVYDIKGENWALTAGWRKEHASNRVLKFDPTAQDGSARFNPLSEIRLETPQEVADAQNIATMLVDPDGKGLVDHWAKTSQALLTGAILHCCYVQRRDAGQSATLADVDELLANRSVADYRHRLLLLIDEFASLKRLTVIEEALAFMAGYGIKAYLIVQDLQQIYSAYGREEGLIGNCHIRVAYAPNKIETAELLSRMAGQTTVVRKQTTISGLRPGGGSRGQRSESMQEVQRPLITADEVMRLPSARKDSQGNVLEPGHLLVFVAGQAPIYGRQILYFRDPVFRERAQIAAPETSDSLIQENPP